MGKISVEPGFNFQLFKELGQIHNNIAFGKATQAEFDDYMEAHLEDLKHAPILAVLVERAELNPGWLRSNPRFRDLAGKITGHFLNADGEFQSEIAEYLGLRGSIRLGILVNMIEDPLFTLETSD